MGGIAVKCILATQIYDTRRACKKRAPVLPADDEQNEAALRRQRCQYGEDRRDEDAETEDELPSVALRQHSARNLSADVSPKEGA